MGRGIGLNDTNRLPWLTTLHTLLLTWSNTGKSGVLACSALKQKYRHLLNSGLQYSLTDDNYDTTETPSNVNLKLVFVYLDCDKLMLVERLNRRSHEIVKGTGILDSQFETLQLPEERDRVFSDKECHLYLEKCAVNGTFYFYFKLKVLQLETVDENVGRIVSFLPIFYKFSLE
jgi:carbohydrate kinase (thermoresistant glucokinase family)